MGSHDLNSIQELTKLLIFNWNYRRQWYIAQNRRFAEKATGRIEKTEHGISEYSVPLLLKAVETFIR